MGWDEFDWVVVGLLLAVGSVAGSWVGFKRLDRDIEHDRTSEARLFFRLPFWQLLPYEAYPEHRRTIRRVAAAASATASFVVAYLLMETDVLGWLS